MHVASFTVERYRSFARESTIKLRKLTLLFGRNNAGKSALVRGVAFAAGCCDPVYGRSDTPLALNHPAVRGASLDEIISKHEPGKARLGLGWEGDSATPSAVRFDVLHVRARGETLGAPVIESIRLDTPSDGRIEAIWRASTSQPRSYEIRRADGTTSVGNCSFNGLVPSFDGDATALFAPLARALEAFGPSVYWLSASRSVPERRYKPTKTTRLNELGSNVVELLHTEGRGSPVVAIVDRWFDSTSALNLATASDAAGAYAVVRPSAKPEVQVPLADTGEGIAQVLPVLTLTAMAQEGRLRHDALVAIEQPELHLHPAAELALPPLFAAAIRAPSRPRFLLETHSETMLLGVQLAVLRGEIDRADVAIYWVRADEEGRSSVEEIGLGDNARLSGWPPGVFSEHVEQAREILLARRGLSR